MADLRIPVGPDELDPQWFADALSADVASFDSEPIGVGVGILGLLWRIHLTYAAGATGPATAVLKLPHTGAESRHLADAFRFYEREVGFYKDAAPRSPIRTPGVFASRFDPGTGAFVLLMEDVAGRTVYDQVEGCPPEEAERDLVELARHHAAWWGSPDLAAMPWVVRIADPPNPQALVPALRQSWPFMEEHFGHLLAGPTHDALGRMADAVVPLMEQLSEPPITLVHGDHRLDNLFFSDDEIVMLDWQIVGGARGPYDVAYFLSQSLVPEERKGVEVDLLRSYHRALEAGGVSGYSFDDCWDDYRLATLFVSVYPLSAGSVDLVNERAVELFGTMLQRSVSAILDLDALDCMPG